MRLLRVIEIIADVRYPLIFSCILSAFANVGCLRKKTYDSNAGLNDNSADNAVAINPTAMEKYSSNAVSSLETIGGQENRSKFQEAICQSSAAAGLNSDLILSSIDGISFHGVVDFAAILARGKSPATAGAGVEFVWWLEPGGKSVSEHAYLVPRAGFSSSPSLVDGNVGLIFGCRSNIENYSGYFANLGAYGLGFSLGIDLFPAFESYYRRSIPSNVPGYNDNQALSHDDALRLAQSSGHDANFYALRKMNTENSLSSSVTYNDDLTRELMVRAQLKISATSPVWQTNMNELYGRGLRFALDLIDDNGRNRISTLVESMSEMGIQDGEDRAFYRNVRVPESLAKFSNSMNEFWGDPARSSSLQNPDGYNQKLMAISGILFSSHKSFRKTFFNPEVAGSDGPGLGSVTDERLSNVATTLYANQGGGDWGCKVQRRNYPDIRWFNVYVNGQKMYADCFGYGSIGQEVAPTGQMTRLIYFENDWKKITSELNVIRKFFDDMETLRFATFNLALQIHDSYRTSVPISQISTGGVRVGNNGSVLSMCNAVSLSAIGVKSYSPGLAKTIGHGVRQLAGGAGNASSAFAQFRALASDPRFTVDISHYYKTSWKKIYAADQLSPAIKSLIELKNQRCH